MLPKKYHLSIVIPAYNEEKKIAKDIQSAMAFFRRQKIKGQVIVSTDGVTDKTNQVVTRLKKKFPHLKLIAKSEKIGKGAAIKAGVAMAEGKYIMFADAGYCVPFDYSLAGMKLLRTGYDIALASRGAGLSKIKKSQPIYRRVGSKFFSLLVRTLMGIPADIHDTQCGFKIYKAKVARHLFADLVTTGFMFDIELILQAKQRGLKMIQFPVEWSNDADTKYDPVWGTLVVLTELAKIKFLYKL